MVYGENCFRNQSIKPLAHPPGVEWLPGGGFKWCTRGFERVTSFNDQPTGQPTDQLTNREINQLTN